MFTLTLHYSPALVRRSAFAYLRRGLGRRSGVALIVLLVMAVSLTAADPRSWAAGAVVGGVAVIALALVLLYLVHYRIGMRKLSRMGQPRATLHLTDSELHVSSGGGTFSAPWHTFAGLWQFSDFWLLLLGPGQFITLPLADLPEEARAFIVSRVPQGAR